MKRLLLGWQPAAFPICNRDVITLMDLLFIDFQFKAKKKSLQINEKTFVGVAGRPAYSLIRWFYWCFKVFTPKGVAE